MQKRIVYAFVVLVFSLLLPKQAEAQGGADGRFVQAYRVYWDEIQNELALSGTNCTVLTSRLTGWTERNGEVIDSLNAASQGLMDRLTEAQILRILPRQEPLLFSLADASARCLTTEGFREAMEVVNKVIGMGS